MKAALSIVLAGLLIFLPVQQVLAQAVQQEAVNAQRSAPSDGAAANLFRVRPPAENAARLSRTMSEDRFTEAPIPNQSSSRPGWKKEILFLVGLAFFIVVVALFSREQAEQG